MVHDAKRMSGSFCLRMIYMFYYRKECDIMRKMIKEMINEIKVLEEHAGEKDLTIALLTFIAADVLFMIMVVEVML